MNIDIVDAEIPIIVVLKDITKNTDCLIVHII